MAKKDFDIDFDFDEAYGFDAKSDPGDEAFDDSVNMDEFSDEELGLSPKDKQSREEDFDLDGSLDDFLNMGEEEAPEAEQSWQEPEQDSAEVQEPENTEPGQYEGEEDYGEEPAYDEEAPAGFEDGYEEAYDEEAEDEAPRKEKKPRKPIKLPKLPKLKPPNIFTSFFVLYFGPVLH